MSASDNYIFVHGGPGLNSHPEEILLKPFFEKHSKSLILWNEPKEFKSTNCYNEIKDSLLNLFNSQTQKVHVLAHSFGAYTILDILPKIAEKVASIILLSPAIDLKKGDKEIIRLGYSIHKQNNPSEAQKMSELMPKLTEECDQNKLDCLLLALQSGYIMQNFSSQKSFETYFSHLTGEHQFK